MELQKLSIANLKQKEQNWRKCTIWFQDILLSYSNHHCLTLEISPYSCSPLILNKCAQHLLWRKGSLLILCGAGKLVTHMQKVDIWPIPHLYQNQLQMEQRPKCKIKKPLHLPEDNRKRLKMAVQAMIFWTGPQSTENSKNW